MDELEPQDEQDGTEKPHFPSFSVVIPTLNEERFIGGLLRDVVAETFGRDLDCEVIVADSGSTDNTREMVEDIIKNQRNGHIRFIQAPRKGVSLARNTGANQANGEYLVFLDADTRLPSGFFKKNLAEMVERRLGVASCYSVPDSERFVDRLVFGLLKETFLKVMQNLRPIGFGAGMIFNRDLFNEVGGFNEELNFYEDVDLIHRASYGVRFGILNGAPVFTSTRRLEKDGRVQVVSKYVRSAVSYVFTGEAPSVNYEFGHFDD